MEKIVKVCEEEEISEIVRKIVEDREAMVAYVTDKEGRLKGVITPRKLLKILEMQALGAISHPFYEGREVLGLLSSKCAKDIMGTSLTVKPDDEVKKAIDVMLDQGVYEVPVVDEKGRLLAMVNYFAIISGLIDPSN